MLKASLMADPSASSVLDVYRRHGAHWAGLRGERLAEGAWLDRLCALLPAGAAVLDLGCGSGVPIARELLRRGCAVTGVDGATAMLELFRRNLPGTPAVLMDMRNLQLGRRFNAILAWDSFFHLSPADQRGMFGRFARHAAPGCALMFTSGPSEGEAVGELQGAPLYHGSLGAGEYRARLGNNGFRIVHHVAEDPDCGGRTVWLAQRVI